MLVITVIGASIHRYGYVIAVMGIGGKRFLLDIAGHWDGWR